MTIRSTLLALALLGAAPVAASAQSADDLFDDAVLHEVRLFVHGDDWRRLQENYRENFYYPADLHWNGVRVRSVGIRSRGYGSRNDRKPGLRVDIDRYVTGQRFLGLKSVILDNVTQDDSLMKERLAMRLFNRMRLPAPREAHARVFVNNEFLGVYVLVESIDKDLVERVYRPRISDTPHTERDGYLFEYHWRYPFYFGYLGSDLTPYLEIFEAKTHERDSRDAVYGPLRELCRLVNESSDEDFADAVGHHLDLDQFVRYVAVENFIAEYDGVLGAWGMNNFYLYRVEEGTRTQLIAWDKDNAFRAANHPIWFNALENVVMRRSMAVPRLRDLYLDTLLAVARLAAAPDGEDARGWLEREVDRVFQQIGAAVAEDRVKPQSNGAFDAEVARLREFARTRSAFVACEVANTRAGDGPTQTCVAPDRLAEGRGGR